MPVAPGFLLPALRDALAEPGLRITAVEPVSGGCIHQALRLDTTAGPFFAKWSVDGPPDLFVREAEGLAALGRAEAELVIPAVVSASAAPPFLVLEWLPPDSGLDDERLGRGLATIHRCTAERFGFPSPTYCGSTRQDNEPADSWPAFYADRRLRPLVEALGVSASDRRLYERVCERLPQVVPAVPPSLIHGDLWSGNVIPSSRGPALVDPACAFADREMEFGITTLFGGLGARAFAAYEEAWPLPPGWRERNGLYQLYHLLNHALLFGGHYAAAARDVARRYVGE